MSNIEVQLFTMFDQNILREIAFYLDLDILMNLVEVFEMNKHVKTSLMDVADIKMNEVRDRCRLLLWIPQHFTRHLHNLSERSLAHVSLLNTVFGDDNVDNTLKYMKHTFTEIEKPALLYIYQFFDKSSSLFTKRDKLYKEILDECIYRQYVKNI